MYTDEHRLAVSSADVAQDCYRDVNQTRCMQPPLIDQDLDGGSIRHTKSVFTCVNLWQKTSNLLLDPRFR